MKKMNCLIVDDEPVARRGLEEYVSETSFLHLAGSCENASVAAAMLAGNSVDLILLDIQMPKVTGIEFLKTLKNPPLVIFTTAYSEYALEGYSLDILDYLVKPIPFDRFLKAVQKAHDYFVLKLGSTKLSDAEFFFVKCNNVFEKVNYSDVLFVEAMQNYCIIHTHQRKLIAYLTLAGLEEKLPADRFLKVHKSFIINLEKVTALDGSEIIIQASRVPIGRSLKEDVVARIMGNNLLKR